MKRLLIMFAILALAIVAMPAFATEAIGPPGVTAVPADFDAALEELKADGTLAALSEEFFGADLTPKE